MPRLLLISLLLILSTIGCDKRDEQLPNTVKISGSLKNDGEPLTVSGFQNGTGFVVMGFHPIIDGETYEETTQGYPDENGEFIIKEGIEPGEYLITVRQWDPYPGKDLLKGAFAPNTSKIQRTIEEDIVLDLDVANPDGKP